MKLKFFMPIKPPTVTHQEKQVHVVKGKPVFYEPEELKNARAKLMSALARHIPDCPFYDRCQIDTPENRHIQCGELVLSSDKKRVKVMGKCKFYVNETCINPDCPMCTYCCPWPDCAEECPYQDEE